MRAARALSGALLLAVVTATLLVPLAAAARSTARPRHPHCTCPVRMACCEAGLCHRAGPEDVPAEGAWSGCRDEAPASPGAPPGLSFDEGLLPTLEPFARPGTSRDALVAPLRPRGRNGAPLTPPPRPGPFLSRAA